MEVNHSRCAQALEDILVCIYYDASSSFEACNLVGLSVRKSETRERMYATLVRGDNTVNSVKAQRQILLSKLRLEMWKDALE